MNSLQNRRGYALLVILGLFSMVVSTVVMAILITSSTQQTVRRAQLLQRSSADALRIRNLVTSLTADQFEAAPNNVQTPMASRLTEAIALLQGSGSWALVSQPSDPAFGQVQQFPANPAPPPLSDAGAIQDFLNPEALRLLGGSLAQWSGIGEFRFRRYDYQTQDLVVQIRTLAFPLLRAPQIGPPSQQNRIAYWKPSDVRENANATRTPTLDAGFHNRGIDEDVSLLTTYSSVPLGMMADENDVGVVPWSLRARSECVIGAPGYIFSETNLRAYVSYCGVTHMYPLDADLTNAPYSIPILGGVTPAGPKTAQVDVSQLGHGVRVVGATNYADDLSAVFISCESGGGNVTVTDSGTSNTPMVVVLVGSFDPAQQPMTVNLVSQITRPTIFLLSHVHLTANGGVTSLNTAIFLDADVDFVGTDPLHVAALMYYGATASAKGLSGFVADKPIPSSIEPFAPRAVIALAKVL